MENEFIIKEHLLLNHGLIHLRWIILNVHSSDLIDGRSEVTCYLPPEVYFYLNLSITF